MRYITLSNKDLLKIIGGRDYIKNTKTPFLSCLFSKLRDC